MDITRYLDRIGVDSDSVSDPTIETLATLQRAHVTSVPFETLAINGDPFGSRTGAGISLNQEVLFEKIVEREHGGFCYELNTLFSLLLDKLGFSVSIRAARVVGSDGARPPANHRTTLVSLDRPYIVDVGVGIPTIRRPLPLTGDSQEDEIGVEWRIVESDRTDADHATEYRNPGDDEWTVRYVFRDIDREPWFFEATCEFLATAPESGFTGDAVATIATERGHTKLTVDSLTRTVDGERSEKEVDSADWYDALEDEFGIDYRPA